MMKTKTIAVIGAGNMGASLLGGILKMGMPAEKIWVTDTDQAKLDQLKNAYKINVTTDNLTAVKNADVVILAVKPQIIEKVSKDLATAIAHKPLVISIAAGIREEKLQNWLGVNIPIVRSMPNTPALIGCGATALHANSFVTKEHTALAESILGAVGTAVWLTDEKQMDAVTALSGSGPAYFFLVIEAMQAVGEELGLPAETARLLTLQTAYGAARMALESEDNIVELRRKVTSPGGTTEAAIKVLEKDIRQIFTNALQAAKNRSEELGA